MDLWCSLDLMIGLIIACLPPLRPYIGIIHNSPYVSSLRTRGGHRMDRGNSGPNTATTGFSRIEDGHKGGRSNMRADVSLRSGGSRVELTWDEAKGQCHEAPAVSCDEAGSEIELAPVRSRGQ
ncbi:hypothetical protein N0V84_011688 [Fusarium piperis]|uniref:Uncharacterized protein n=1 Tax=Fusarium piperis TaxID=1435070 RepID=A0A9W8TA18_9HYPO|nr:hypothetical protein N0V84_011688 [Fusarium piperis]